MKTPRIVDAMNCIDDDLISWAVEYRPAKIKAMWFRYVSIAAFLCLIVLGAVKFYSDRERGTSSELKEYSILGEVLDNLENGQYAIKTVDEDQNFSNGVIVTLTPSFHYVTYEFEERFLKKGDIVKILYSEFNITATSYTIIHLKIDIIQSNP